MDLSTITENDTGTLQLKHPVDGAPLDTKITIAGPEHPKRKALELQLKRDARRRIQKAGKLVFDDPEEELEQETDFLVACTLAWENLAIAGKAVPFDIKAAREIYTTPKFAWIRRQVRKALDDAEVFTVSSPTP